MIVRVSYEHRKRTHIQHERDRNGSHCGHLDVRHPGVAIGSLCAEKVGHKIVMLSGLQRALAGLSELALKSLALLVAFEAALAGALALAARLTRKRQGEPRKDFPWEDRPEVETGQGGDRLKLYTEYEGLYRATLDEIERAERHIFIETFVWAADEVGRSFVEALARKAREGVEVYAVFDGLANLGQPESFKQFPEEIYTLHFRPFSGAASFINPRNIFRDHRKFLAVDGRVAFVGGFNIGELYTRWRDTHLRLTGPAVREAEGVFVEFWNRHRSPVLPEIAPVRGQPWDPSLTLQGNDPSLGAFPLRDMYLRNMDRAQQRIYLSTAYLILGRKLRSRLIAAAHRGADVQILFPKKTNHALVDWLARRGFSELLRGGVRIFAYDEQYMIHAKTATMDGVWSTVGSANVDSLSFFGLYENNFEIYDEQLAGQMEAIFELDKTNAEEITLQSWESRPLPEKLIEYAISPLRPFG